MYVQCTIVRRKIILGIYDVNPTSLFEYDTSRLYFPWWTNLLNIIYNILYLPVEYLKMCNFPQILPVS